MQERVLKLADLSEFEQKHLRQQAEDPENTRVEMRGNDSVVVHSEVEESVDLDPREGVDVSGVQMTDEVAQLLEEPFSQPRDPEDRKEPEEEVEKPFEPDPADVRNFIRCMLGNRRFTKEYSAYGGHLKFTLGARTHAQDEDIVFSCANLRPAQAIAHMTNMRLCYSLIELRVGKEHKTFENIRAGERVAIKAKASEDADLAVQAEQASAAPVEVLKTELRMHELREQPQAIYGVLSTSMREFDMLVTALTQRAMDPKHWATDSAG